MRWRWGGLGAGPGADPLQATSWRFRWRWRRLERRAAAEETRRVLGSVRGWGLDGERVDLDLTMDAERITTAVVRHGGWRAELRPVTPYGRESLLGVRSSGRPIAVRDAGRYGPFWWLAVDSDVQSAVVLGGTLRLVPEDGGPGPSSAAGPTPPGESLNPDSPRSPRGLLPA